MYLKTRYAARIISHPTSRRGKNVPSNRCQSDATQITRPQIPRAKPMASARPMGRPSDTVSFGSGGARLVVLYENNRA